MRVCECVRVRVRVALFVCVVQSTGAALRDGNVAISLDGGINSLQRFNEFPLVPVQSGKTVYRTKSG